MKSKSKTRAALKSKPTYLREVLIHYKKKKVQADSPVGKSIKGAKEVVRLFSDMQDEGKEKLISVSLDAKLKIICYEVVALGSAHAIYTRPMEAIRSAITLNAYAIILVHNHPSGDPSPSKEDKAFTAKLTKSTRDLGLVFQDHIIIGQDGYFSFDEKGLMKN